MRAKDLELILINTMEIKQSIAKIEDKITEYFITESEDKSILQEGFNDIIKKIKEIALIINIEVK